MCSRFEIYASWISDNWKQPITDWQIVLSTTCVCDVWIKWIFWQDEQVTIRVGAILFLFFSQPLVLNTVQPSLAWIKFDHLECLNWWKIRKGPCSWHLGAVDNSVGKGYFTLTCLIAVPGFTSLAFCWLVDSYLRASRKTCKDTSVYFSVDMSMRRSAYLCMPLCVCMYSGKPRVNVCS